jgi:hypothetical protein
MESAGAGLKRIRPELVVSKQKLRQAEGSCMVRLRREEGKQNVGFSSRPFVLCGLPVRKPPKGKMLYERHNGDFVLQVTGHPNYGLPFGQDRIVPIYLATLAVRQQSQTIRFRTAAEMLETFGMHKGGKEYRRLVAAFGRLFGATIFFGTDTLSGTARVVQRSRFSFFNEAQIWYSRDPEQYPISDQFENVIVLSDEFYREITAHPIPADLETIKVLAGHPLCWTCSCGFRIAALWQRGKRAFLCLGRMVWRARLGQLNIHARAVFGRSSTAGWSPSACSGRSARPNSAAIG